MSDLKDLQNDLSNDLTISGVDAATGLFTTTGQEGMAAQSSMDALVAQLDTVAAALTPANAAAKSGSGTKRPVAEPAR